ncbi:MAG: hypothetical protein NVS4B3_00110 [Gemmatimonadaceae bacterium]
MGVTPSLGNNTSTGFELGINYWPRRTAMYMWREFDLPELRDELAQIADIGFDTVRFFALAQDFLPQPGSVDAAMVRRLVELAQAISDAGLRSVPTLIVLNMSGHVWWPTWMIDARGRAADLYADPVVLHSQALLVEQCTRALAGDGSIRAVDITNEVDDAQRPSSRGDGRRWAAIMAAAVRRATGRVPLQIGTHLPSLTSENHLRIDDLAGIADEDVMHAYPLYCSSARSFLDPELVPFSCALTAGLAQSGRPTLMQEFGVCTAPPGAAGYVFTDDFLGMPRQQYLASEDEATIYYHTVLRRLVQTGAAGAYAWCYADYDARLFERVPFATAVRERTFGLVRADGSEKPAAGAFRDLRQHRDGGRLTPGPIPKVLDVSADDYYCDPTTHFNRLYDRWVTERA